MFIMKENFNQTPEEKATSDKKPISPHRLVEEILVSSIDRNSKSGIFSRKDNEPNSLFSYYDKINNETGVPLDADKQTEFYLQEMDRVNLDDYYIGKLTSDKIYTENVISADFNNRINNPTKFQEKILEVVYAHCLVKAFIKKDVVFGGDDEEISLDSSVKTHPYDLNKRQVQQILSIKDERYPNQEFALGLGVQWGHENTSYETIKNRILYIIKGIVEFNSLTEICYSQTQNSEKMPVNIPLSIVGGDINHISYFIDKIMKEDYTEIAKSSLLYNAISQIKTQMDLFYKIALQKNKNFSKLKDIKNILDQVYEANRPFIEKAKPDSIHKKIIDACHEIGEQYDINLSDN